MKFALKFALSFVTITLILSIELKGKTLFHYIHKFHRPYTEKVIHYSKKQSKVAYTFVKKKLSFSQEKSFRPTNNSRNKYGHLIYTGREKEQLLDILSKAVKKQ